MKKIILILIILPLLNFAQDSKCTSTALVGKMSYHTGNTIFTHGSGQDSNTIILQEPIVLNTFFHINRNIPVTITEEQILGAIAYLNINFNQFNIFFKYRGFRNLLFDDTPFDDMLNIQIMSREEGGAALNTSNIQITYKAFTGEDYQQSVLAHELGHIFGLLHTNCSGCDEESNFTNPLTCNSTTLSTGSFPNLLSSAENVTRIKWLDVGQTILNPDYNAETTGDFVVDTPASYSNPNVCLDNVTNELVYLYSNEIVDNVGEPYIDIDENNFMSNNRDYYQYKTKFTDGQGIRMRETILNEPVFIPIRTTIASLYEPYKEIEGFYTTQYFFQPGFDYDFVYCDSNGFHGGYPIPSDYDDISFIFNDTGYNNWSFDKNHTIYNQIFQRDHTAIRITQIDDYQPRRCYSTMLKGGATSGTIIKYEDDVLNTNVSIIYKDSLGINNQNLIRDLENGLYIIRKNYIDGSQEQKTIFKNEN